jgi:ABC-type uncharacterized transport system fused permease/ATPase subunit
MSKALWALGGYALFVAAVFLLVGTRLDLQEAERKARDAGARVGITQAAYAESLLAYRKDTVRVTRWATRYDTIRDTVDALLSSDTVQSVPASWVRQLITVSDSTVAACRDLVSSTRGALTACDSAQSALRVEADAWKLVAEKRKPSRFQRVLPWAAAAAGFWVGAKLRVP